MLAKILGASIRPVLAFMVLGTGHRAAIAQTPPPPAPDCNCVSHSLELRLGQIPAPYDMISHWGDIVLQNSSAANPVVSQFPPPGGVTPEFKSLCGGLWYPGKLTAWSPLSMTVLHNTGQTMYHPGNEWLVRCPPPVLWSPQYPINLDPHFGAAAGDYPPRKLDLRSSSAPMVSALGQSYGWPTALAERSLIGENVDLLTGQPLLQEADFELPFGSATFRWNRTYSEVSKHLRHEYDSIQNYQSGRLHTFTPASTWWDWAGQGWMTGVAPVLLIDATNWGYNKNQPAEPRCYFLPDAHHSVPFILQGYLPNSTEPRVYAAPPRFGMVLGHNGAGTVGGGWTTRPTEWYIWTHQRSLRYTFAPVYDDIGVEPDFDTDPPDSEHLPPDENLPFQLRWGTGKSYGVPHYAVLKRIDDLNGNRVDLEYTPFLRDSLSASGLPLSTGCTELIQRSQMKGQIKRARLLFGLTNSDAIVDTPATLPSNIHVAWTIVPVYRSFGGSNTRYDPLAFGWGEEGGIYWGTGVYSILDPVNPPERFDVQHALDSVLVYEGNYAIPTNPTTSRPYLDQTLPNSTFAAIGSQLEEGSSFEDRVLALKAINQVDAVSLCNLSTDWQYRVRYIYADGSKPFEHKSTLLEYNRRAFDQVGAWERCPPLQSPRLLLTTVTRKAGTVQTVKHKMYRYLAHYRNALDGVPLDIWSLQGTWGPERLEVLRNVIRRRSAWTDREAVLADWPFSLMVRRADGQNDTDDLPVDPLPGEPTDLERPMLYTAEHALEPWDSEEAGRYCQELWMTV